MQGKKYTNRMILRVLKALKRSKFLALFLGLSLVLGAVALGNQVLGNEKNALFNSAGHPARSHERNSAREEAVTGQEEAARENSREKVGQEKTGQEKTGQEKAGQEKAGQEKVGQEKVGQEKAGQEKVGQEKAGQEKAGQENTDAPEGFLDYVSGQDTAADGLSDADGMSVKDIADEGVSLADIFAAISNEEPDSKSAAKFKGDRLTVLLAGLDRRPADKSLGNTDTLLVVSVNILQGKVALLSVPRDTQVMVPGYGKEKINAAARVGQGIKTTTSLVEELIGQPINGYVVTDFNGFKSIIDTLGGVTIDVEKDMYYASGEASDGVIDLKKGVQRLNGDQALQYARFRQDALADISRASRQQAVMKAVGKEILQLKTVPKLPWLIPQITKSVETNFSLTQLLSLGNALARIENPEITVQTLPGSFLIENDISYWLVNPEKAHAAVKKLFEEGEISETFGF